MKLENLLDLLDHEREETERSMCLILNLDASNKWHFPSHICSSTFLNNVPYRRILWKQQDWTGGKVWGNNSWERGKELILYDEKDVVDDKPAGFWWLFLSRITELLFQFHFRGVQPSVQDKWLDPGTFMRNACQGHEFLNDEEENSQATIKNKSESNSLWKKCRIVLSSIMNHNLYLISSDFKEDETLKHLELLKDFLVHVKTYGTATIQTLTQLRSLLRTNSVLQFIYDQLRASSNLLIEEQAILRGNLEDMLLEED